VKAEARKKTRKNEESYFRIGKAEINALWKQKLND